MVYCVYNDGYEICHGYETYRVATIPEALTIMLTLRALGAEVPHCEFTRLLEELR